MAGHRTNAIVENARSHRARRTDQPTPSQAISATSLAVDADVTLQGTITYLQRCLGISDHELAAIVGATPRSVARWRDDAALPQRAARRRIGDLVGLCERLLSTFEADDVQGWLRGENRALGGLRPIEAVRAGRLDRVHDALEVIDSGIFV